MTIGLYSITNKLNNNTYIGISYNIERRFEEHKQMFIDNKHHTYLLQYEYNSNPNIGNYTFTILEQYDYIHINDLKLIEDTYILKHRLIKAGYRQQTNLELHYKHNSIINPLYMNEHTLIHNNHTKQLKDFIHIKEGKRATILNVTINNYNLICDTNQNIMNTALKVLMYIYNNTKDLNNVTISDILEYSYHHCHSVKTIKNSLITLTKYKLINLKGINKINKDTKFNIITINNDKAIDIIAEYLDSIKVSYTTTKVI